MAITSDALAGVGWDDLLAAPGRWVHYMQGRNVLWRVPAVPHKLRGFRAHRKKNPAYTRVTKIWVKWRLSQPEPLKIIEW